MREREEFNRILTERKTMWEAVRAITEKHLVGHTIEALAEQLKPFGAIETFSIEEIMLILVPNAPKTEEWVKAWALECMEIILEAISPCEIKSLFFLYLAKMVNFARLNKQEVKNEITNC